MRREVWAAALLGAGVFASAGAQAQAGRLPADAVDGFHAALKKKDTALALSFLDRSLVVFEFGSVDPTIESYALKHLPSDIDMAQVASWNLQSRRVGGEGNERWVLSSYRVQGTRPDGRPIDQITQETAIVRRAGEAFRIVHLHWSTNSTEFQAWARSRQPPP
ncbi:MAG: hypothetical protein ACJ8G7_17380 [Rhizobacter sp.]